MNIPIVFLHGFLGSGADWKQTTSFLSDYECICLSLPGHGKAPFTEKIYIPFPHFHLVGYSMGGRIAMQYAHENPEQIASLTVMSAHPGLKTEQEKKDRLLHDAKWAGLLAKLPIDDFLLRWYDQPIFKSFKPNLTMRREQNIPDLIQALLHYSLGRQPVFDIDHVLIGSKDEKFQQLYKNPIIIPDAGHCVHLENPKAVADIIRKRVSL